MMHCVSLVVYVNSYDALCMFGCIRDSYCTVMMHCVCLVVHVYVTVIVQL